MTLATDAGVHQSWVDCRLHGEEPQRESHLRQQVGAYDPPRGLELGDEAGGLRELPDKALDVRAA